jgi:CheY-like chemotaxis protein
VDANGSRTYISATNQETVMLVRCPRCRTQIRLTDFSPEERVVPYLCNRCGEIVRIDLILDEVKSSAAPSTFERLRQARTVLVADDSPAACEVAADLLQEAGHKVLTASDGPEALARIRDHHPDAVVIKLMLPGLTAFELLREIRRDPRLCRTPVLIVSRVYKPDMVQVLSSLGARGFIDRQRLVETLAFRVSTLLDEAEQRRHEEGGAADRLPS